VKLSIAVILREEVGVGAGALIVSLEESKTSSILPEWAVADLGHRDARISPAKVGCLDSCNAHSSIHDAMHN
jgi:hypothetical protein